MEFLVDAEDGSAEVVVSQIGLRSWARLLDLLSIEKVV